MAKEDNPFRFGFLSLHDLFWRDELAVCPTPGASQKSMEGPCGRMASDAKLMGDINIWMNLNIFH